MTIQGMSQGLTTPLFHYYMRDTGYPGGPSVVSCGSSIDGTAGIGIYRTAFNMNAGTQNTGASIIVFEVGDTKNSANGTNAVQYALGDKLFWEYNGTFGCEYSACHMGDTDNSGNNPDVMHGMGYMRGLIGAEVAASKNASSAYSQPSAPLSQVTGSRLTSSTTPDDNDKFGNSAQYEIDAGQKEYEYLKASQATAAGVAHGTFKDLTRYLHDGTQYQPASSGNFCGPYTGHNETEIADINGNTFTGASAVTLHENDEPYSSRQAMMVVPIVNGGVMQVHVESPLYGTWHRHKVYCPIDLPKWGNADNKVGIQSGGSAYANCTQACPHNFSDPENPTTGSIVGQNTTYYHVNSQDKQYRQQGTAAPSSDPWSGTARDGGHVISALNHNSAASPNNTQWAGVVNRFDWVFKDSGAATRVGVGFYAIDIGGTNFCVEVGDTDTTGTAQAGVVKDITTC